MCRCFDWSRLATSRPSGEDVREFGVLYEHLLPYMKKTLWPSDIDTKFKGVARGWPDTKTAQIQYVVLARRVREAAEARGHSGRDWWTLQGYTVEPIKSFLSVSWFVRAMCHDEAPRLRHRIASVISAFMGLGIAGWGRTHSAQHCTVSRHQFFMSHRLGHEVRLRGQATWFANRAANSGEVVLYCVARRGCCACIPEGTLLREAGLCLRGQVRA